MDKLTGLPEMDGWYWRRQSTGDRRTAEQVVRVTVYEGEYTLVEYPGTSKVDRLREPTSPDVQVEWYGPIPSPWEGENES